MNIARFQPAGLLLVGWLELSERKNWASRRIRKRQIRYGNRDELHLLLSRKESSFSRPAEPLINEETDQHECFLGRPEL